MAEYIKREEALAALNKSMNLSELKKRLERVPAADVVPVRHGKWKKSYADHEAFGVRPFFRYCSECSEATVHPYNYCPNCGAKMDLEGMDE